MTQKKSKQGEKIEALFLLSEEVTVCQLYEALYGDPGKRTDREMSQALGPALTRYCRRTGNDVSTVKPYTYILVYS